MLTKIWKKNILIIFIKLPLPNTLGFNQNYPAIYSKLKSFLVYIKDIFLFRKHKK